MCAKGLGASNLCWRHSQCAISDHDQESFQSLRQGKQPESICISWLSAQCHSWLPCDCVSIQYCNKNLCLVQNCICTGQDSMPASEMLVLISWHANAGSRCVFPQASCDISAAGLLLCYIQHSQGTLQGVPHPCRHDPLLLLASCAASATRHDSHDRLSCYVRLEFSIIQCHAEVLK